MNATNLRVVPRGILQPKATSSSHRAVIVNDYNLQNQRLEEVENLAAANSTLIFQINPNRRAKPFVLERPWRSAVIGDLVDHDRERSPPSTGTISDLTES